MRSILATLALMTLMPCDLVVAQVLQQSEIGPNGCGPCAFINSLHLANAAELLDALEGDTHLEKARAFIKRYGDAPSIPYRGARTAYSKDKGAVDVDFKSMLNRFAEDNSLPALEGEYIFRREQETATDFVKRFRDLVQSSIDRGFHPLLSVRAIAAEFDESRDKHVWNSKGGHFVAIHSVDAVGKDGLSFAIEFSDSLSGALCSGYLYMDLDRPAVVPMDFTVDQAGKEKWNWMSNENTLALVAPSMPLGTKRAKWNERTIISLRYLIYRP